jgi:5-oxoprolinase (ATP-hydrolysing)
MAGGEPAQCGLNLWVRRVKKASWERSLRRLQNGGSQNGGEEEDGGEAEYEERFINLGAKNSAPMAAGDRIIIHTPGGGGWGKVGEEKALGRKADPMQSWKKGSHAAREETALQA